MRESCVRAKVRASAFRTHYKQVRKHTCQHISSLQTEEVRKRITQ